jgi:hypothetical protein
VKGIHTGPELTLVFSGGVDGVARALLGA